MGSVIAGWDGWRGSIYRLAVGAGPAPSGLGQALLRAAEDRLPTSGRAACTRSSSGPTTTRWRSGRRRTGSIRPGSSASPGARRPPVAGPTAGQRGRVYAGALGSSSRSAGADHTRARQTTRGMSGTTVRSRAQPSQTPAAVGDVVGDVDGDGAHRVEVAAGRRPSRRAPGRAGARAAARRVRRKASPSTKAGDQARVSEAERRQRRARRAAPGDPRRHADGVADEAAQAVGQDDDGRRQRGRASTGRRASSRPDRQRPAGDVQRAPRPSPWRRPSGAAVVP